MPKLLNKHHYNKNLLVPVVFALIFIALGAKLIFFSHASGLPPTVSITVPTNNALVCGGATTISASATDNSGSGLNNVQFKLDGTALGSAVTSSPYNYSWDNWITDAATSGSHALTATATDNDTNATTSNSINVVISEPGDVDCDGTVSGHDLSILLANYSLSYPAAEFDGGSTVTGHDLSILLTNYGKSVTLPPTNSALPTISGTDTEGDTLTATNGTWNNSPTSYTYQWQDCDSSGNNCANISTATSSSYVLQSTDVNDTIRVVVTATNAGGSEPATSGQTGVVTSGGSCSDPSGACMPAANAYSGYTQVVGDEFTGMSLNQTTWNGFYQDLSQQFGPFLSSHGSVGGGEVTMSDYVDSAADGASSGTNRAGTGFETRSGWDTGMAFVRARADGGAGVTMVMGMIGENTWPPEIDFYEDWPATNARTPFYATAHYGSNNSMVTETDSSVDATQWHTYGVEWNASTITYLVDGNVWSTIPNPGPTGANGISSQPMSLFMQIETLDNASDPVTSSTPATVNMNVDWATVYTPN